MNILLAFFQMVSILVTIFYEYKNKHLSVFLWATLLIMFSVPHFLSILLGYEKFDSYTLIEASLFVFLFNLIYLLMRYLLNKVTKKKNDYNHTFYEINQKMNDRMSFYLFILLCGTMIVFGVTIILGFGSILNVSWGGLYTLNQNSGVFNPLRIVYFLFFASAGVCLVYRENKRRLLFILSMACILFYSLLSGNRTTILPLLLVFIIPIIFSNGKRLSLKKVGILATLGFLSIYFIYFLRFNRIYGGFYSLLNNSDFLSINSLIFEMILNGDGELGLRNAFYYFIDNNNHFPNFNEGHTYIRLILILIPSSFSLGLKPPDFAISMGSAWINDFTNNNYSMHPTLYGDVFANFWWVGILSAIFWAIFNSMIDKIAYRKNPTLRNLLFVVYGGMYIIIARGSVYNAIFLALVSSLLIFAVYLISKIKLKVH